MLQSRSVESGRNETHLLMGKGFTSLVDSLNVINLIWPKILHKNMMKEYGGDEL